MIGCEMPIYLRMSGFAPDGKPLRTLEPTPLHRLGERGSQHDDEG